MTKYYVVVQLRTDDGKIVAENSCHCRSTEEREIGQSALVAGEMIGSLLRTQELAAREKAVTEEQYDSLDEQEKSCIALMARKVAQARNISFSRAFKLVNDMVHN